MSSAQKSLDPLPIIAGVFGAAGAAKLVGVKPVKRNFKRWGYPRGTRLVVGLAELTVAAHALMGSRDPEARKLAGAGTVVTMAGALITHKRAGDAKRHFIAPIIVGALGYAAYNDMVINVSD
jgi:hypothetical protein